MKKNIRHIAIVLVLAVVSTTAFFSCNTTKRTTKQENKIVKKVKNSVPITEKLKDYFFQVYPCTNDTVTNVIQGEQTIVIDTLIKYTNNTYTVLDTVYIELQKTIFINKIVNKTDTIVRYLTDQRQVQYWRDSANFANQRATTFELLLEQNKEDLATEKKHHNKTKKLFIGSWLIFAALVALFLYLRRKLKGTAKFINGLNL